MQLGFSFLKRKSPYIFQRTQFSLISQRFAAMSLPKFHKVALAKTTSDSTDVIEYTEVETPQITGPKDVIIKNKYAGVNFIEAYFRKGLYPAEFPFIFGKEASGVVAAVGDEVSKYKVGDKVAYLASKAYAQYTKIPEDLIHVKTLPADASDEDLRLWAACNLQGLTAISLAHEAYEIKPNDFILIWAAAGGVGQILTKYAAHLGAKVIAVASTDEKLAIAKSLGAKYSIRADEDVPAKVAEFTANAGAIGVFDSVGNDTFEASMKSVARKGTLVSFGNASGPVPPIRIATLASKNMKICRTSLYNYLVTQEEWDFYSEILQKSLASGLFKISYTVYPLSEYKQATEDLEGRKSTGKLILEIPQ